MIEVIFSAMLVVVLALATLKVVDNNTSQAALSENRSIATNLAHAELNRLRLLSFDAAAKHITDHPTRQETVKGKTFTINTTAHWAGGGGQVDLTCNSGDSTGAQYIVVRARVSWPNMGNAKPVTAETILAARGTAAYRGTLAFKVQDTQGNPVPGVTVTAQGITLVTDEEGCVIFTQLNQGTFNVTYSKTGYVDSEGKSPGVKEVSVAAGQKSLVTVIMDQRSTLNVSVRLGPSSGQPGTPGGNASWRSVSVVTSGVNPVTATTTGTNPATAKLMLPPSPDGYRAYAGSCVGNDPANYLTNPEVLPESQVVLPGGEERNANAYVRRVTVTVDSLLMSTTAYMKIVPDTSNDLMKQGEQPCNETWPANGSFHTMGKTGLSVSQAQVDLPYGVWKICLRETGRLGLLQVTQYDLVTYNNYPDTGTLKNGIGSRSAASITRAPNSYSKPSGWPSQCN